MGDIHYLPTGETIQARLLEKHIEKTISSHPDQNVAKRWNELAQASLKKYPGPPMPSQAVLDLDMLTRLTDEEREAVVDAAQGYLESYFEDVRQQLIKMHSDMLRLQKTVAEYEQNES
ncbi:MAG: hypothetical protein V3U65_17000 [Granulosicoccaceae bacterium]